MSAIPPSAPPKLELEANTEQEENTATSGAPIKDFDPAEFKGSLNLEAQKQASVDPQQPNPQVIEEHFSGSYQFKNGPPINTINQVSDQQQNEQDQSSQNGITDPSSSWGLHLQSQQMNGNNLEEQQQQQQQFSYRNRWSEVQEHEMIAHSSMDRKRQNLEMLRDWDMRRAYFLNIHRTLLEKIIYEVEVRWECSNQFTRFVANYMENQYQQQAAYSHYSFPKPDTALLNNQLAKTAYFYLRGALQLIDDSHQKHLASVAKFTQTLQVDIMQNLLQVNLNESLTTLSALRSELQSLKARMTELNQQASRKSGKVALVYNTYTPKTGYKKINQKPKDLYKTQINFLRNAEMQTETQRHFAKVVLSAWEKARSLEGKRAESIENALKLYCNAFIECYGDNSQISEMINQFSQPLSQDSFAVSEILKAQDIKFLREQLMLDNIQVGDQVIENKSTPTKIIINDNITNNIKQQQEVKQEHIEKEIQQEQKVSKESEIEESKEQQEIKEQSTNSDQTLSGSEQLTTPEKIRSQSPSQNEIQNNSSGSAPSLMYEDLIPFFENFIVEGFDNRMLLLKNMKVQRETTPGGNFKDSHLVITADNYLHCFDQADINSIKLAKLFTKPHFSLCLHKAILRRVNTKNFLVELSIQAEGLFNYLSGSNKFFFNFRNSDEIEELAQFINSLN